MKLYKRYVDVIAYMTKDKKLIPMYLFWDNRYGRQQYSIDKIYEIARRASQVGGAGIMYRVKIQGQERKLFFECNRWFIESYRP